ncbi:MAG: WYL domain-containing protein [Myxococcales bacterium]|nr:WYL domain-containing protein [Myxococcales bacterium]
MSARLHRGRNDQLIRVLAIIRALHRADGCDLYELAGMHGTTTRTIRRDLEALQAAGLPLVQALDGRKMRWRIAYPSALSEVSRMLDASHYLAVVAALASGLAAARPSTRATLVDLAKKLLPALTPRDRTRLVGAAGAFGPADQELLRAHAPDVLLPLVTAIAEQRLCDVRYTSVARRRSRMEIVPLRLRARGDTPYLLAYLPKRDDLVTLALDRMRSLHLTDQRAELPSHIGIDRYAGSLFGIDGSGDETTYRLLFASVVAPYIHGRRWHPSQRLTRRRDGSVELTFTCRASVEVEAWVASWRHNVEVLGPLSLKMALGELGRTLVERYRPEATAQEVG